MHFVAVGVNMHYRICIVVALINDSFQTVCVCVCAVQCAREMPAERNDDLFSTSCSIKSMPLAFSIY